MIFFRIFNEFKFLYQIILSITNLELKKNLLLNTQFFIKKISFSAVSGLSLFRFSVYTRPAALNNLSELTELGGADKYFRTIGNNTLNWFLLVFHHSNGSLSPLILSRVRYFAILHWKKLMRVGCLFLSEGDRAPAICMSNFFQ